MKYLNIGNRIVNNYILETSQGYVVIDTGYAGGFAHFCKNLQSNSINMKEIKYIFITHVHDDHVGFLNELIDSTNATVIMDNKSPERLLLGQNIWEGGYSSRLAKAFSSLFSLFGKGEHRFPIVKENSNFVLWDGKFQPFEEIKIPLKILSLPGHTKDSIGLLTEDGLLFCGDAAMNGFPSIKRNIIWMEDLEEYKASWDTMLRCGANLVLPSHGKAFPISDLKMYYNRLGSVKLYRPQK